MTYLVDTTNLKKKFCNHDFKTRYQQSQKKVVEVSIKCGTPKKPRSRKPKTKNENLLKFMRPASKPTILILPLVAAFVEEFKFLTNWETIIHNGWHLPAILDKYVSCGIWQTMGCLNEELHENLGKGRRVFIKQFQRSCYRLSCKECFLKAIARQANRMKRRIEKYDNGRAPIQIILSVPLSQADLPYLLLKKRMRDILKIACFEGGVSIFHPFRFDHPTRKWKYKPHFHVVGFGNEDLIPNAFGSYGWYVKICEERESVFQTFCYLLSHSGVKKRVRSMTWFGELSYRKKPKYSKVNVEEEQKITGCPVCGDKFVEVYHEGIHPIVVPEKYYEGLVDSDGKWFKVEKGPPLKDYRFDYDSRRDLNEILKSLAEAN